MSVWVTILHLEDDPPYRYQQSHILPSEDGPRDDPGDGLVQLATIPSFITRDGRDDQPEDGAPWPWLRLSVNEADTVLHARQVREVRDALIAWLEQADTSGEGEQPGIVRGTVPAEYVRLKGQLEAELRKMTACAAQPPRPGAEEGRAVQEGIAAGIRSSLAWAIQCFEGSAARGAFLKRLEER
jgi:hypothetical protein